MVDETHISHTNGLSGSYLGHSGNTDSAHGGPHYPSSLGNSLNTSYTGHSSNADIHYPSSQLTAWLDGVYSASGSGKLSNLVIDTDKDWQGYDINNMPSVSTSSDFTIHAGGNDVRFKKNGNQFFRAHHNTAYSSLSIYGNINSGKDLYLYANEADLFSYIQIDGSGSTHIINKNDINFWVGEGPSPQQIGIFDGDGTFTSLWYGGHGANRSLKLLANDND